MLLGCNPEIESIFKKKMLAFCFGVCIIEFVIRRKEFYNEQRRISTLVGFGTFEPRKRAARNGRNPQTGKEIKIPAKTVPVFSAGKKFKEVVNGK